MSCWEFVTGLLQVTCNSRRLNVGMLEVCCLLCSAGVAFRRGEDLLQEIKRSGSLLDTLINSPKASVGIFPHAAAQMVLRYTEYML